MNREQIIRLSNTVAMVAMVMLVYWVFVFISITVFGFKVFRENITQTFYLSVLGVLALLAGAVAVNVILNLSRIADALAGSRPARSKPASKPRRLRWLAFLLSFPVLFAFLYVGDLASSAKKREYLTNTARRIVEQSAPDIERLAKYEFTQRYVNEAQAILKRLSGEVKRFPSVSVIVADDIDGRQTYLAFNHYSSWERRGRVLRHDYLFPASIRDRDYLREVFEGRRQDIRFSAHDGSYELYFPLKRQGKIIVLYFTDRSQYGKIGS